MSAGNTSSALLIVGHGHMEPHLSQAAGLSMIYFPLTYTYCIVPVHLCITVNPIHTFLSLSHQYPYVHTWNVHPSIHPYPIVQYLMITFSSKPYVAHAAKITVHVKLKLYLLLPLLKVPLWSRELIFLLVHLSQNFLDYLKSLQRNAGIF